MADQEPFRALVADPGWRFGDKLPGAARGAERNYKTMTVKEICAFPLPTLYVEPILFLWRVAAMQEEALQVCRAWGFTPKAELIWLKRTIQGARWFGMGHYVRNEHETCIIATRGTPMVKSNSIRSTFEGKVGRHSEKPDEFYQIVEELAPGPYVELFARRQREGWLCMGDEMSSGSHTTP